MQPEQIDFFYTSHTCRFEFKNMQNERGQLRMNERYRPSHVLEQTKFYQNIGKKIKTTININIIIRTDHAQICQS